MKNYFEHKDNVFDKTLVRYLEKQCFNTSTDLKVLTANILFFYSHCLYNGDKSKALSDLNGKHNEMRKKDAVLISFFGGASFAVFIFMLAFFIIKVDGVTENDWNELYSGIVVF